jgi:hypothetical protein
MGLLLKGEAMQQKPSALSPSAPQAQLAKDGVKRRREHLRHIHRMTHEQQIALIEEARAARMREQQAESRSSAYDRPL